MASGLSIRVWPWYSRYMPLWPTEWIGLLLRRMTAAREASVVMGPALLTWNFRASAAATTSSSLLGRVKRNPQIPDPAVRRCGVIGGGVEPSKGSSRVMAVVAVVLLAWP